MFLYKKRILQQKNFHIQKNKIVLTSQGHIYRLNSHTGAIVNSEMLFFIYAPLLNGFLLIKFDRKKAQLISCFTSRFVIKVVINLFYSEKICKSNLCIMIFTLYHRERPFLYFSLNMSLCIVQQGQNERLKLYGTKIIAHNKSFLFS